MRTFVPVLVVVTVLAGCGWRKAHLTDEFGRSYDAAFAAQTSDRPVPATAVKGLDPQEAALISAGYRGRLAPPGAPPDQAAARTIIVAPQDANAAPLPPSVPRD